MDPALLREREAFKKGDLSISVVEKKKEAAEPPKKKPKSSYQPKQTKEKKEHLADHSQTFDAIFDEMRQDLLKAANYDFKTELRKIEKRDQQQKIEARPTPVQKIEHGEIKQSVKEERSAHGHLMLVESMGSLLDDANFSDITLKIGKDTLRAHKAILASRSKVFEAMFKSGMKENQEGVVHMVDMKPFTAKAMLQYIYTGVIEKLSMDRAMDLYSAADRYDLQELRGWCKDFIMENVSADQVYDLVVMADLHGDEELAKTAKKVFQQECKTMVKTQAWREFAKDNLSLFLDLVESALLNES